MSLSMPATGLVMHLCSWCTPEAQTKAERERKTVAETHVLAHGETQLCQHRFICNVCSEHRWELGAWVCRRQLAIQCDDSGLSVSLQAKDAQTLLRQNFHIYFFFMIKGHSLLSWVLS